MGEQQYSSSYGRSTRRMKLLRKEFRAACQANDSSRYPVASNLCWLDGKPIDFTLPSGHPESHSLDHALTVEDRPDLAEDPANFRAAHLVCNQRRGTEDPQIPIGQPSEVW